MFKVPALYSFIALHDGQEQGGGICNHEGKSTDSYQAEDITSQTSPPTPC